MITMSTATFSKLLDDLESYLQYKRDEGVERLEVERTVLNELARMPDPVPEAVPLHPAADAPETFGSLEAIVEHVSRCRSCPLHASRTHTVPGEGNGEAPDILFVGEGPGADEDAQGRPFVGKAGELLTRMIEAMGYRRDEVYIANIVKCRPPNNRTPRPEEMEACLPYLRRQIGLIRPRIIIALGATAVKGLLGDASGITRLRGNWQEYEGIRLMPTFHPSYLLRDPSKKKEVWQDLRRVLEALGREPPPRK